MTHRRPVAGQVLALGLVWLLVVPALAILLMPLLLALLMVLFDRTAQGLMELLAWLLDGLGRYLLPGSIRLPPYEALRLHPWPIIAHALPGALACLLGLLLTLLRPQRGAHWLLSAALWAAAVACGGRGVLVLLLPASVIAILLARAAAGKVEEAP